MNRFTPSALLSFFSRTRRSRVLFPCAVLSCAVLSSVLGAIARAQSDLLVSSRLTDQILRYDGASGAFKGVFASGGGLDNPVGLTFGPDGDLYVANDALDQVLRYDGQSGAFLGVFAQGGGLNGPRQVNFGLDGELYVASGATNQILRYDGVSGAFLGVFASGGTLRGPTSFTFGSDGTLYVASVLNNRIKRYDGVTGAYLGNLVTQNLNGPHDLSFGPDGLLYVTNAFDTRIGRFDPVSGIFLGDFVVDPGLVNALGLTWDEAGHLLVANQGGNDVRRYDRSTGAFLGSLVLPGAGGLSGPLFSAFLPQGSGLAIDAFPDRVGERNWVHATGARPGSAFSLLIGRRPMAVPLAGCPGHPQTLPFTLARVVADESGQALFSAVVPTSYAAQSFFLQAAAPDLCATSLILSVRF